MIVEPNNGKLPATNTNVNRNRAQTATSEPSKGKSAASSDVSGNQDSVLLSPEATALKRLEAQINASPDIDRGRVAAIKQAINEGSFEINVERIAEKLLQQDDLLR